MKAYERLLKYTQYPTGSDPECPDCPSNPKEWDFARDLKTEMESLGFVNVDLDENCYLMGELPSNIDNYTGPVIGLIAHMDVSSDAPYEDIKPQIVEYTGGRITLNEEKKLYLDPEEYPVMNNYIGCHIMTSDGTTLLGADDKAGIAEIFTMAERFQADENLKHGTIKVCITPDEEIGRSSDFFDLKKFNADAAYTLDGSAFGEVESQTFSADAAVVTCKGVGIHPGSAKGKMINAIRVAQEFDSMLPEFQRPEYTEGFEGFYHITGMKGNVEDAELTYILRDFDNDLLAGRGNLMQEAAEYLNRKYGEGTVEVKVEKQYRNMGEVIDNHPVLIDLPIKILEDMGVEPDLAPIRGGTDGAFLSFKGLPCPNLGTGGFNFHGRKEFAVIESMDQSVELIISLMAKISELKKEEL